jgi:hypothetical protein
MLCWSLGLTLVTFTLPTTLVNSEGTGEGQMTEAKGSGRGIKQLLHSQGKELASKTPEMKKPSEPSASM